MQLMDPISLNWVVLGDLNWWILVVFQYPVDVLDLLELIAAWGSCDLLPPGDGSDDCDPDLNGDGNVDVEDLLELIAQWS